MRLIAAHNKLVLPVVVALCLCVAACGAASHGAGSTSRSASAAVGPSPSITGDYDGDDDYGAKLQSDGDNDDSTMPKDRDNDNVGDDSGNSYFDADDEVVRLSGHVASAVDRTAITRLVKRYFAVANAEDGMTACSMIVSSFAKSVPETLGRPPGPPYARGTTCAAVMSKVFAHYHRQLAAHATTLEVNGVRVDRGIGVAVLAFRTLPGRQIRVAREGGVWRMDALLDLELP
jgi:hypothetical protein